MHPLSFFLYVFAAFCEIAGCFTFWLYFRLGRTGFWLLPGMVCLILFAFTLSKVEVNLAGRAYAIYGGIYISCSLIWLWMVEDTRPDGWDLMGAFLCLAGAGIILFAPRS